jgi:hypothetical protein
MLCEGADAYAGRGGPDEECPPLRVGAQSPGGGCDGWAQGGGQSLITS